MGNREGYPDRPRLHQRRGLAVATRLVPAGAGAVVVGCGTGAGTLTLARGRWVVGVVDAAVEAPPPPPPPPPPPHAASTPAATRAHATVPTRHLLSQLTSDHGSGSPAAAAPGDFPGWPATVPTATRTRPSQPGRTLSTHPSVSMPK